MTPRACIDCDRPMRPGKTPPSRAPGTIPHYGRGRCVSCATKAYRVKKNGPRPLRIGSGPEPFTDEELARIPSHLAAWIMWRRARMEGKTTA